MNDKLLALLEETALAIEKLKDHAPPSFIKTLEDLTAATRDKTKAIAAE